MLRYLRWLSIAGVWLPTAALATWAVVTWIVGALAPEAGYGLVVAGVFVTFALSHALLISSLVGTGLLLTRHALSPAFTLLSVAVGGVFSAFILLRVYFDVSFW